jgi:hypothetical protein
MFDSVAIVGSASPKLSILPFPLANDLGGGAWSGWT